MNLRQTLRKARQVSGWTQKEVALELGLKGPQYISNMERGRCAIPLCYLVKMAKMYQWPPEDLIEKHLEAERGKWKKAFSS